MGYVAHAASEPRDEVKDFLFVNEPRENGEQRLFIAKAVAEDLNRNAPYLGLRTGDTVVYTTIYGTKRATVIRADYAVWSIEWPVKIAVLLEDEDGTSVRLGPTSFAAMALYGIRKE